MYWVFPSEGILLLINLIIETEADRYLNTTPNNSLKKIASFVNIFPYVCVHKTFFLLQMLWHILTLFIVTTKFCNGNLYFGTPCFLPENIFANESGLNV